MFHSISLSTDYANTDFDRSHGRNGNSHRNNQINTRISADNQIRIER